MKRIPFLPPLLVGLALGTAAVAHADREHVVNRGQTLSRIAARYGIATTALAAANRIARAESLREGQVLVVPPRGVIYARPGDSLFALARRYDVSVRALARRNRLRPEAPLRIGQRLLLPGFEPAERSAAAERRWGRPKRPGTAVFHRLSSSVTQRVRLVDHAGRVRRPALKQLARLMRPRQSRQTKRPHPRLARLLARISDHFGGRPIHIVSGYRRPGGYTRKSSRHVAGQAIDFRIVGVSTEALRDYCQRLSHVGVGYYPRSNFVHLDVRRTNARWTDISGPGEAPRVLSNDEARAALASAEREGEPAADDDGLPPVAGIEDEPVDD